MNILTWAVLASCNILATATSLEVLSESSQLIRFFFPDVVSLAADFLFSKNFDIDWQPTKSNIKYVLQRKSSLRQGSEILLTVKYNPSRFRPYYIHSCIYKPPPTPPPPVPHHLNICLSTCKKRNSSCRDLLYTCRLFPAFFSISAINVNFLKSFRLAKKRWVIPYPQACTLEMISILPCIFIPYRKRLCGFITSITSIKHKQCTVPRL